MKELVTGTFATCYNFRQWGKSNVAPVIIYHCIVLIQRHESVRCNFYCPSEAITASNPIR